MSITTELLIIFGLVLANGFFAAAEIAILTARRGRLERLAAAGSRAAGVAQGLAGKPGRFLPTVQVGMTLIGTLASVFSGATVVRYLADRLREAPSRLVAEHYDAIALGAVVLGVSFVMLVLGELVPKQLALANAERLAQIVALPMQWLETITRPVVWFMEFVTAVVLRLLGTERNRDVAVSIEDIEHLLRAGTREGILEPAEQMVARRALRLGDRTVREILRPRIEIDALDVDTPPDEVIGAVAMAGFSRLPVHEGDLDHIIGFIYTKDLLLRQHMGWPIELRKLVRPALLVPETMHIDKLLERFREKRTQMALVLDEFGGTVGLVTMEDVLEELVGEIHDEYRQDRQQDFVQRDDGSWLVDAGVGIHELLERVGMEQYASSLPPDFSTVGGLVLSLLGRIPNVGDCATWNNLRLEVADMDGRRLDRILVSVTPTP
jgi:putative hemolysin